MRTLLSLVVLAAACGVAGCGAGQGDAAAPLSAVLPASQASQTILAAPAAREHLAVVLPGQPIFTYSYLPRARSAYTMVKTGANEFTVTDKIDGNVYVYSASQRLILPDESITFDADFSAPRIYRLYQAAFKRKPDIVGQGFWMNKLDVGFSLKFVADAFVASAEFKALYGAAPSNRELVDRFYQNVLGRAGDATGTAF